METSYNISKILFRCGVFALVYSGVANAANLEISKFLEVGVAGTDNLTLAEDESPTTNDIVFNIKPSVELKYSGNRFGLVALGEVEYLRFTESSENLVDPRLFLRLRGTVIDNLLFLDSSLALTTLSSDNNFIRPTDDGDTVANSNTTLFIDRKFGEAAELYAGYTYSTLIERNGGVAEFDRHTFDFRLEQTPVVQRFYLGAGGTYNFDQSEFDEYEDSFIYGKLGYSLTKTLLAELTYGVESRELISSLSTDDSIVTDFDDEQIWNAQLKWAPSEFTSLNIGYGERFLSSGPILQLNHRVENSSFFVGYSRSVTRQAPTLGNVTTLGSNLDTSITNTDSIAIDADNSLTILNTLFVDNRFQLGYKLTGRRSDIVIDTIYSDQEPVTGSADNNVRTLLTRLLFDRKLNEFLSFRLQYDYQRSRARNQDFFNYTENRFSVKFIYSFDGNDNEEFIDNN